MGRQREMLKTDYARQVMLLKMDLHRVKSAHIRFVEQYRRERDVLRKAVATAEAEAEKLRRKAKVMMVADFLAGVLVATIVFFVLIYGA